MKVISVRFIVTVALITIWVNQGAATEAAKPNDKAGAAKKVASVNISKRELIDINTASQAELKVIPGLGDAVAARLIAKRPYANKAQLVSRKVLSEPVYEKIKHLIIAKQPPRAPQKAKNNSINKK